MSETAAQWGLGKRLGFVFLAVYLTLVITQDLLGIIPPVGELWLALWSALMPTLGNAVFGIADPIQVAMTGSGDMTWDWIRTFWMLVLALVTAALVVAVDRQRTDYRGWYAGLRVLVRYALSLVLFGYGLAKLTGNQFVPPSPLELARSYGDSSPMGLAWTFMGFSTAYCWFTGLAEILAGALLAVRRTTTLGALLACGVMANVVAINFCFDVPVKLYSSHLLFMAMFLVTHDARRLIDFLILARTPAPPEVVAPPTRRMRIAGIVGRSVFVLALAGMAAMQAAAVGEITAMAVRGPLYGAWEVEAFTIDGVALPPGDGERWRQVVIGEYPYMIIRPGRGEIVALGFSHDAAAGTVSLVDYRGEAPVTHVLTAELLGEQLTLRGSFAGAQVVACLRHIDTENSLLVTRGFHWVNERPYNR